MDDMRKRPDMLRHGTHPYNAEPPAPALLGSDVTGTDDFYVRCHGAVPEIAPDELRLQITGLVERPRTLTLEQLRTDFEEVRVAATLQCAGNRRQELLALDDIPGETPWRDGAISTAWWTGVRLRDVLEVCGVQPGCGHVAFLGGDLAEGPDPQAPFGGSVPLDVALDDDVLLAWGMNDRPLPSLHGGPLRVVVPGYVAARSVKWVVQIEAQAGPSDNYYQRVAYRMLPVGTDPGVAGLAELQLGPTALTSAIVTPAQGATVLAEAGEVEVTGYALAGRGRRVARMEVSGDGGRTWTLARLGEQVGRHTWVRWSAHVPAQGEAQLVARAWDDSGSVQPEDPRSVRNAKGYANSSWPRRSVTVG